MMETAELSLYDSEQNLTDFLIDTAIPSSGSYEEIAERSVLASRQSMPQLTSSAYIFRDFGGSKTGRIELVDKDFLATGSLLGNLEDTLWPPVGITFSGLFWGDSKSWCDSKSQLRNLLAKMFTEGVSWNFENTGKITFPSLKTALSFLELLPPDSPLPVISADGEGGVIFAWENSSGIITLVTIDDWLIHIVTHATTPSAQYQENIPFFGTEIPDTVLEAIKC